MVQQSRFRLLLAVTFVSTAIAQTNLPTQIGAAGPLSTAVPTYPDCAASCLAGATGGLPCEETDTRCLCSHQADVRSSVQTCLGASNACSPEDTSKAAGYYETVCDALGLDQNGEPSMVIGSSGLATATDIGSIPTASSSPTRTAASASSSPTKSSAASSDKSDDDDNDNGLSVATVAGIAAGCAFIAVAIITGLIWLYVKRRDGDDETVRELESQLKKSGFEGGASSFKTAADKSEKDAEFAMTAIPPRPAARPQPPSRGNDRRPTLAERRQRRTKPLHRSPSEAMQTSTYPFPFGDKSAAEASVTSLTLPSSAGKPVSAVTVQRSLSKSQLSDAGSIYSVSSEEPEVVHASEARLSRPTTFYNMYSGGQDGASNVNLAEQPSVSRGQGSLRKNKFNLQVSTPPPLLPMAGPQPSPNPFTTPPQTRGATNPFTTPGKEERKNPFESVDEALSPVSPQERYNPLAQNPNPQRSEILSGSSFGKFDFEIGDDQQNNGSAPRRSLRDSFFGSLDMGFGKNR